MTKTSLRLLMLASSFAALTSGAFAQTLPAPPPLPEAATPPPPAATPPAAAAPAAPPPVAVAPSAAAPAAPRPTGEAAPPATGTQLPQVEIIQEPPKPKVAEPEPAKPKPKVAAPTPAPPAPAPVAKAVAKAAPKRVAPTAPAPTPAAAAVAPTPQGFVAEPGLSLNETVKTSPIGGSELPIAKIAGGVARVTAQDIQRQGSDSVQQALQANVPGVIVSDLQGNGFQTDVQYRGFSASPVDGQPQGIAVYQNGVRINEAFGDTVNWDFLPSAAINDITVTSNNPAFGLNAIGGSISIALKDGFNYHGGEIDARAGSFGRRQGSFQAGAQSGGFGAYVAYERIRDNGWRDFSPSSINRLYSDLGVKDGENELHINLTRAHNSYGVVAATPVELLNLGYNRTYTSPQTTVNDVIMPTINATAKINETLKLSGVAYYRNYSQRHVDGNPTNADDCNANGTDPGNAGSLCVNPGDPASLVLDQGGNPIATTDAAGNPLNGEIDRSSIDSESYGGSVQAVEKSKLFGLGNQFLVGASIDHGRTAYRTNAEFGTVDPVNFFVNGTGLFASTPFDLAPRNIRATNDYYGIFFQNALDITDAFTLTVGGRYNFAQIELQDLTGAPAAAGLNGRHSYERFNPQVGGTYKLPFGASLYAGYSEANRAPTPAELSCSDPNNPCIITSFLTADPPLKQVVARTVEAGLRGEAQSLTGTQKLTWNAGFFRTENTDDIIAINAPAQGRGFFQNAGTTLRQGVELSANYRTERLLIYGAYNFVDATFQSDLQLSSPNNPSATLCDPADPNSGNCINVRKGDRLSGIPAHKFKAGIDYWLTPQWKLGGDLVAASGQFFRGDESNLNSQLPGYATVNLHTSYDLSKHIQIYGLINNLFDKRYGTYGTYYNLNDANSISNGIYNFQDPRTITPGAPLAAYGGLKIKF